MVLHVVGASYAPPPQAVEFIFVAEFCLSFELLGVLLQDVRDIDAPAALAESTPRDVGDIDAPVVLAESGPQRGLAVCLSLTFPVSLPLSLSLTPFVC